MKFIISGKNIDVTDALKERIQSKLGKLNKFFNEDTEVTVTLSVEKTRHIVEVTIPFKGMLFRAEQENEDMYTSIDKVVDVLERQIVKNKKRLEKRFKEESLKFETLNSEHEEEGEESRITKVKRFDMKPMLPDEAILQMNLLGHEFFAFKNADTDLISVLYKKKDGNYGLIEPQE